VGQVYIEDPEVPGVKIGERRHPALPCSSVETDNPNYIFAKRLLDKEGGPGQSLYLPHGSVAFVVEYDEDRPRPLGFALP
jgi:hypothetical protein